MTDTEAPRRKRAAVTPGIGFAVGKSPRLPDAPISVTVSPPGPGPALIRRLSVCASEKQSLAPLYPSHAPILLALRFD